MEPVLGKQERDAAKVKLPYRLNKENNLEWELVVPSGKVKAVRIKYSVEHPKQENVYFKED